MSDSSLPPNPNAETAEQSRDSRPGSAHDASQRRDGLNRERFAIQRDLRELTNAERRLERRLRKFADSEYRAKKTIERQSRVEHWGREPERPWAWRTAAPDPEGPDARLEDDPVPAERPGGRRRRLRRGWKRISGR